MFIVLVFFICLFDKQIEASSAPETAEWSVSLSNVVIISAMTKQAVKRCIELEPGLVFELVENSVRYIFFCLYNIITKLKWKYI